MPQIETIAVPGLENAQASRELYLSIQKDKADFGKKMSKLDEDHRKDIMQDQLLNARDLYRNAKAQVYGKKDEQEIKFNDEQLNQAFSLENSAEMLLSTKFDGSKMIDQINESRQNNGPYKSYMDILIDAQKEFSAKELNSASRESRSLLESLNIDSAHAGSNNRERISDRQLRAFQARQDQMSFTLNNPVK